MSWDGQHRPGVMETKERDGASQLETAAAWAGALLLLVILGLNLVASA